MIDFFIKKIDLPNAEHLKILVRDFFNDGRYDIEIVTLKGHLLLEHNLNESIEKLAFKKGDTITEMSFSAKLSIAEAFGMFEGEDGQSIADQIRILNKLRNDIAHRLNFSIQRFQELLRYHPELDNKLQNRLDDVHISLGLTIIVAYVSSYMTARLRTKINVNNLLRESPINIESFLLEETSILARHKKAMSEF